MSHKIFGMATILLIASSMSAIPGCSSSDGAGSESGNLQQGEQELLVLLDNVPSSNPSLTGAAFWRMTKVSTPTRGNVTVASAYANEGDSDALYEILVDESGESEIRSGNPTAKLNFNL